MKDLAANTAIVVPVRDEAANIIELLRSFEHLSLKPREIIIVDSGSKDDTVAVIREYISSHHDLPYKLRLIELESALPGKARNTGIESSSSRFIACTDAGGIVEEAWLKQLLKPFSRNPRLELVIGNCLSYAKTPFEEYAFSVNIKPLDETKFIYSGAVSIAFLKEVFEKVNGFPEEIYPKEDKCFLTKLKQSGVKSETSPKAVARWRPRANLKNFAAQYFSYAQADGRFNFVPAVNMLRILAFILGVIFVVLGFTNKVFWIAPLSGLLFYLFGFALKLYPRLKRLGVFIYIPVLLLVKDISQAFGYTLGLLERLIKPKYRRIAKEKFLLKK